MKNILYLKKKKNAKRIYLKRTETKVQRWTNQECLLYEYFIEKYQKIMKDSGSKRNTKIFQLMSKFIGKTPSQCRSHHQKFYKKVIENLANHKTQDSYFYDASDEVDKSQNRDTIISKISQKDISDKLEKLERSTLEEEMLQKAVFINKMINPDFPKGNTIIENEFNSYNLTPFNHPQKFSISDLNLTPQLIPQKPKQFDFNLNFDLNYKNEDFGNVSWKKVFTQIEKVEESLSIIINLMAGPES